MFQLPARPTDAPSILRSSQSTTASSNNPVKRVRISQSSSADHLVDVVQSGEFPKNVLLKTKKFPYSVWKHF